MKQTEKTSSRLHIKQEADKTSIRLKAWYEKSKQQLFMLWIIIWALCGAIVIAQFFGEYSRQEKIFFIVWIGFWLYFLFIAVKAFRWRATGVELIEATSEGIRYVRQIGEKGIPELFEWEGCTNFRLYGKEEKGLFADIMGNSYWVIGGECVAFDYYGTPLAFGMNISEKDAQKLLALLKNEKKKIGKNA